MREREVRRRAFSRPALVYGGRPMGISRQDRPQMFRRVLFDRVPEVRASDVVHDDAPATPLPPIERPRRMEPRRTQSILLRVATTSTREPE